jgi:hypothetical protein
LGIVKKKEEGPGLPVLIEVAHADAGPVKKLDITPEYPLLEQEVAMEEEGPEDLELSQ